MPETDLPETELRCPFCPTAVSVSPDDPDASFGQILSHVRRRHESVDQSPAVLWPKIKETSRA